MGFACTPFRVAVTGGRRYTNRAAVYVALDAVLAKHRWSGVVLVHGNGTGADRLADQWAKARGVRRDPFPADWKKYGPAAGPIRNQEMVDSGLNGCVSFPGGTGTADMVRRCRQAGVPVWAR